MAERYWEAGELPNTDLIRDWISDNVVEALTQLMDQGKAWLTLQDERLVVTFCSFDKPEKEGEPGGPWHKKFDLLDMAMELVEKHEGLKIHDGDLRNFEKFAKLLDELAAKFRERAGLPPA